MAEAKTETCEAVVSVKLRCELGTIQSKYKTNCNKFFVFTIQSSADDAILVSLPSIAVTPFLLLFARSTNKYIGYNNNMSLY